MPYAVKLLHPGSERSLLEPNCKDEGEMDWAIDYRFSGLDCGGHRRKFLSCNGQYMKTLDTGPVDGMLMFWGEWEPPSHYKRMVNPCRGRDGLPSYIHTPSIRYIREDEKVLNTDPYVLGTTFYYSCCQQARILAKHDLDENSLILFGSRFQHQFVLDTVFVVDRTVEVNTLTATAREAIIAAYPDRPAERLLFAGKMRTDEQREMFSFFPCSPSSDIQGFERPHISIDDEELKSFGFSWSDNQGQGFACSLLKNEKAIEFWKLIVNKVLSQSLCLGVYAEEPALPKLIL